MSMDQASRILARCAGVSGSDGVIAPERIACGAWARAVGKTVAERTRAVKLVRTTLVVEVENDLWRRNLWGLRWQILRNLTAALGSEIVTDVELRVMPPRRDVQRETGEPLTLVSPDEAESISDPGMRRLYRASRKRVGNAAVRREIA